MAQWKKDAGFTLVELMIVVGIVGLLVGISSSRYDRYQARTRQSEAKISLGAIYSMQKTFYSEYSAYCPGMPCIGYTPEGFKQHYMVGWALMYGGNITGLTINSSLTLPRKYDPVNNPFANPGGISCANGSLSVDPTNLTDDPQTFSVVALGVIRDGASVCDNWTIDHLKILRNTTVGY